MLSSELGILTEGLPLRTTNSDSYINVRARLQKARLRPPEDLCVTVRSPKSFPLKKQEIPREGNGLQWFSSPLPSGESRLLEFPILSL
jgi:hypothetical protein